MLLVIVRVGIILFGAAAGAYAAYQINRRNRESLRGSSLLSKKPHLSDMCPICFEHLEDGVTTLVCGHKFHQRCINMIFSNLQGPKMCPVCRKEM